MIAATGTRRLEKTRTSGRTPSSIPRIVAAKRSDDIHSPTLTQLAVARFLASGEYPAQAERARAFYRHRLDPPRDLIETASYMATETSLFGPVT